MTDTPKPKTEQAMCIPVLRLDHSVAFPVLTLPMQALQYSTAYGHLVTLHEALLQQRTVIEDMHLADWAVKNDFNGVLQELMDTLYAGNGLLRAFQTLFLQTEFGEPEGIFRFVDVVKPKYSEDPPPQTLKELIALNPHWEGAYELSGVGCIRMDCTREPILHRLTPTQRVYAQFVSQTLLFYIF